MVGRLSGYGTYVKSCSLLTKSLWELGVRIDAPSDFEIITRLHSAAPLLTFACSLVDLIDRWPLGDMLCHHTFKGVSFTPPIQLIRYTDGGLFPMGALPDEVGYHICVKCLIQMQIRQMTCSHSFV